MPCPNFGYLAGSGDLDSFCTRWVKNPNLAITGVQALIPALGSLKLEDCCNFEATLDYIQDPVSYQEINNYIKTKQKTPPHHIHTQKAMSVESIVPGF